MLKKICTKFWKLIKEEDHIFVIFMKPLIDPSDFSQFQFSP